MSGRNSDEQPLNGPFRNTNGFQFYRCFHDEWLAGVANSLDCYSLANSVALEPLAFQEDSHVDKFSNLFKKSQSSKQVVIVDRVSFQLKHTQYFQHSDESNFADKIAISNKDPLHLIGFGLILLYEV